MGLSEPRFEISSRGQAAQRFPLHPAPHSGTINWRCEEALCFPALHLSLSVFWPAWLVESISGWLGERGPWDSSDPGQRAL